MESFFQSVALMTFSHLVLGAALVCLVALCVRLISANAATRHDIWLAAMLFVALMPLLAVLAVPLSEPERPENDLGSQFPAAENNALEIPRSPAANTAKPSVHVVSESAITSSAQRIASQLRQLQRAARQSLPLAEIGAFLVLLISVGMLCKLCAFVSASLRLRQLTHRAERASPYWQSMSDSLAGDMGIRNYPTVWHSAAIRTPFTSGLFSCRIVFPSSYLERDNSPQWVRQVLMHELAHVKRRDPLVAYLQAILSIFLFWHPALLIANRRIRFERELACDDWVVQLAADSAEPTIKSYAKAMLAIASTLGRPQQIGPAVACVQTRHRLEKRIEALLNSKADHTVSVRHLHSLWVSSASVLLLLVSSPVWPRLGDVSLLNSSEPPSSAVALSNLSAETQSQQDDPSTIVSPPQHEQEEVGAVLAEVNSVRPEQGEREFESIALESLEIGISEPARHEPVSTALIVPATDPAIVPGAQSVAESGKPVADERLPEPEIASPDARVDSLASEPVASAIAQVPRPQVPAESIVIAESIVPAEFQAEPVASERRDYIVIDDLSRKQLMHEIEKVQTEIYRVFNKSVGDRRLKIKCDSYKPTGSYIEQSYCEPQFVLDARSRGVSEYVLQTGTLQPVSYIRLSQRAEFEELTQAMNELLGTSAYFAELNRVLRDLKEQLRKKG